MIAPSQPEPVTNATTGTLESGEQSSLMGQGLVNGIGTIFLGVIGILLVPIMLRALGTELFGIWLFASMTANTVSVFVDLGIHVTIIREVGAAGSEDPEVAQFVRAASNFYLRLAIAGALAVLALGIWLIGRHVTTAETAEFLTKVFLVVSIGFIADQLCSFQLAVLQGLRRFDLSNLLSISFSLLNALAIVSVLALGGRLIGVVEVEALVSILSLVATYGVLVRVVPRFSQRPSRLRWDAVRPHVSFSLLSQLSVLANAALWNGPALLLGLMLGPTGLVPYQLGSKFPLAVGNFAWELAAVMIPIASRHQNTSSIQTAGETLQAGTRFIAVLTLPVFIVLWVIGPDLLHVWLGTVPLGTLLIFRLMILVTLISTADLAASGVLLGRGMASIMSATICAVAVVALTSTALLLEGTGPAAAAWALLVSVPIAALVMLRAAGRACHISLSTMAWRISKDLLMPAVFCACACMTVVHFMSRGSWLSLLAAACAGAVAHFGVYGILSATEEERMFIQRATDWLADTFLAAAAGMYPVLRSIGRTIGIKSSNHPHLAVIIKSIIDPYKEVKAFDSTYATTPDPWGYTTNPDEQQRHLVAVRLLEGIRPEGGFDRVFEIGCSEGVFTKMLAPLCRSLLAVDFSEIALHRARTLCDQEDRIDFAQWNLRSDSIPGHFDLIVVMDVLTCIRRPGELQKAYDKLISGLHSGDILLAADYREEKLLEESWLGKRLRFGGKWVIDGLVAQKGLETLKRIDTEDHVFALMRKL